MRSFVANLFFLFILAFTGIHCGEGDVGGGDGLVISGNVKGANSMQVYLDKVGVNPASPNLVVARTEAEPSGAYELTLPETPNPGIYRLRIGTQKVTLILDGTENNINVSGDLAGLNEYKYEVTGSAGSEAYHNMVQQLISRQASSNDVKSFIETTDYPLAGMLVAVQALGGNPALLDIHQTAKKRLEEVHPGSEYIKEYDAYLTALQREAVNPGGGRGFSYIDEGQRKPAPDIKLPSPNGKEYALSDLKGKVVLLDFWASWCRPCRMENPNVVKIYNKYKDQGFTVYSVSLDGVDSRQAASVKNDPKRVAELKEAQKDRWVNAIEADGLVWDYHVSDLKKWECEPAQVYGVNSIPRTFMIDKEGRIAAVNLRGAEQIEDTLLKLL